MEREVKLSAANYCYKTEYTDVYHVGKSKIHIFSSLEGFITEEDCFKLSKVETSRILLPTPVYQNGRYVGCRTKWQEKDWIYAFYNSGMSLKRNLIEMKEELELLSMLGYDIVDMPFYYSHYDRSILTFDGTFRIRKSDLEKEELERRNKIAYQEYLRNLVYNGMSEFEADPNDVVEYLYSQEESVEKRLEKALHSKRPAGNLIRDDIIRRK